jgi:hypothetical protein
MAHVMEVRVSSFKRIDVSVGSGCIPRHSSSGGVRVSCLDDWVWYQIFPWQLVHAVGSGEFFSK